MYDEKVMLIPTSWLEDFKDLSEEVFGKCLRATMASFFDDVEPKGLSNFEYMVYRAMKAEATVEMLKEGAEV